MTDETPASVSEQAARLYTQGASISAVAKAIGRSYDATRALLVEAGVRIRIGPVQASSSQQAWNNGGRPPLKHQPSKLTPQQHEEIRRRRAEGETLRALAAEYGVSPATIHRYS
ncbi:helix-turn-helix domain-containing protein [Streptomyces sp. NK08204]|uniref:helix-turn-helix domain-containing protein n=1 Tax=Streptomyces sp. NK08204 TaxID=2873260 RepID=UPI001CED4670|nr:helix-turn-helix domain-containing protein [Streptomyces sp. NK08204]